MAITSTHPVQNYKIITENNSDIFKRAYIIPQHHVTKRPRTRLREGTEVINNMPRRLEVKMKLRYTYQEKMANEMNLLDIESDLTVGSCGNVNISY
jgi:hypothetical protein